MDYTSLAAVTFANGDQVSKRAFYQDGVLIKESCFDSQNGWYTVPHDVVADDARPNSPIAATNWEGGKQTRVYYLDKDGVLRQRVRATEVAGDSGEWRDAADFPQKKPMINTKLAATRSDEDGMNIHLFYQETGNYITQLKFDATDKVWEEEAKISVPDAKPGTSLAVSTRGGGELRLYYQNNQDFIKEFVSDADRPWNESRIRQYQVAPFSSICTVAWDKGSDFEIRTFAIGVDKTIVEMAYVKRAGGWERTFRPGNQQQVLAASPGKLSSLAAVRIPKDGSIDVFYQPESSVIGLYSAETKARVPLGIPITRLSFQAAGLQDIKFCTQLQTEACRNAGAANSLKTAIPDFATKSELGLPISSLWPNGQTLRVRMLGGSSYVRGKVRQYASEWERHANIRLSFIDSGNAEIRIAFMMGQGSWSVIGTDARNVPDHQPTMNFGWLTDQTAENEFSRVIIHEFGHALGCIHEHQSPSARIPWNREAVYAYYAWTQRWSRAEVDRNIFQLYSERTTQFTQFDPTSIMLYHIPANLTLDGSSTPNNMVLSQMDKAFISRVYPK